MSVLKSLESKIASLVEGSFGRVFRSEVRPVEIARKLAREMEQHRSYSLSRTYVPNEFCIYLSPRDRAHFVEEHLASDLAGYLLDHARREDLSLLAQPKITFRTDERLQLGEFGIETAPVQLSQEQPVEPRPDAGHTMVFSAAQRVAEPLQQQARVRRALLVTGGKRMLVPSSGGTIGRSRDCDVVLPDPNASRKHAELRPRGGSWVIRDLGSTNGTAVNGQRIDGPQVLNAGDQVEIGGTVMSFEVE